MADVKKVIELEIDTDTGNITKILKDLNSNVEWLADTMQEVAAAMKSTVEKTGEVSENIEDAAKSSKKLTKEVNNIDKNTTGAKKGAIGLAGGFNKVGLAIKATGIGFLLGQLVSLKELFTQNQAVADGFKTATNFLTIAFNDFFKFIQNNVETVTGFFKSIFEDPLGSIKQFGEYIQDYIIKYTKQAIEGFGLLGESIGYLLDGEFSKALDVAAEGATKLGSAALHLNPLTAAATNLVETIVENKDAIAGYITDTLKSAEALTEQAKTMEMSEINSRRLQLQNQKLAEEQRQIRDDETRTIADRLKANKKLGEILIQAAKDEKAEIQTRIDAIEKENLLLGEKNERNLEIQRLKAEQLGIEERIGGVISEQLVNENSLIKEQIDAIKELDAISADETQTRIIELEQLMDERIRLANLYVDDEIERNRYLEEIELSHQDELKKIQEEARLKKKEDDEKAAAEEIELRKKIQDSVFQVASSSLSALSELNSAFIKEDESNAEAAFKRQKALGIASAIISTSEAAINAYKSTAGIPVVGPALAPIAAATAIAAGIAQVQNIKKQEFKSTSTSIPNIDSSGNMSIGGGPQFNTVGNSGINQLSQSIAGQNQKPVQAYVVANDISSAQSMERNRVQQASFP